MGKDKKADKKEQALTVNPDDLLIVPDELVFRRKSLRSPLCRSLLCVCCVPIRTFVRTSIWVRYTVCCCELCVIRSRGMRAGEFRNDVVALAIYAGFANNGAKFFFFYRWSVLTVGGANRRRCVLRILDERYRS